MGSASSGLFTAGDDARRPGAVAVFNIRFDPVLESVRIDRHYAPKIGVASLLIPGRDPYYGSSPRTIRSSGLLGVGRSSGGGLPRNGCRAPVSRGPTISIIATRPD